MNIFVLVYSIQCLRFKPPDGSRIQSRWVLLSALIIMLDTLNQNIQDATSGLFQPGAGEPSALLPAWRAAASDLLAPRHPDERLIGKCIQEQ